MAGWVMWGAGAKALVLGTAGAAIVLTTVLVTQHSQPAAWLQEAPPRAGPPAPAPERPTAAGQVPPEPPPPPAPTAPDISGTLAPAPAPETPIETEAAVGVVALRGPALAGIPDATSAAAAGPVAPAFDVVRIEADGAALVAGRAEVGAGVAVLVDGVQAAATRADAAGRFVALFTLAPSSLPRVMMLRMTLADGTSLLSADRVLVAPTLAVAEAPSVAVDPPAVAIASHERAATAQPASPLAKSGVIAAADPATVAASASSRPAGPDLAEAEPTEAGAPGAVGAGPSAAVPPMTILLTGEGTKVLQPGQTAQGAGPAGVSIDTIAYSASGQVTLSGQGVAESVVRLYLDNRALLDTRVAADGTWGGTLPAVAAGVYTLRADLISAQGRVTARYETPFQREEPRTLRALPDLPMPEGAVSVTVQPGYTLWRIARDSYGDGVLYVRVYQANRDQIRDPDLIYPGQVLALPAPD